MVSNLPGSGACTMIVNRACYEGHLVASDISEHILYASLWQSRLFSLRGESVLDTGSYYVALASLKFTVICLPRPN